MSYLKSSGRIETRIKNMSYYDNCIFDFERRKKMNDFTRQLLEEEIQAEIKILKNLPDGCLEKENAIESLTKLYKVGLDDLKLEMEAEASIATRKDERAYREAQLKEQKIDRIFKLVIELGGTALTMGFYAYWMKKGFEFEETGTITSNTFRGLTNRFRPTKN